LSRIEVKRDAEEIDLPALKELLSAAGEADAHPALGEHAWLDLVQGGREGFAGLVAWEDGHPHPVGYAQVSLGPQDYHGASGRLSWALEVVVDPHHRVPGNTVAQELVRSAIDLIAREGGGHLHLWVNQPHPFHDRMAAEAGLKPGRALYQMRRRLPLAEHATVAVRPFELGRDETAWLELNNSAFAWHPEQGGWTADTLKSRQVQPWFNPADFLLLEEEGALIGFCWTKIHPGPAPVGEIYVVAVAQVASGRGLGRQMVLAGLDHIASKGITEAMLYVDADNYKAVKLYVDLGFTVNHIDRAYTGDIAPASPGPN